MRPQPATQHSGVCFWARPTEIQATTRAVGPESSEVRLKGDNHAGACRANRIPVSGMLMECEVHGEHVND